MSQTGSRTRVRDVHVVMVPVSDQDRAIEFYVEKLGFELRADIEFGDADRWVEVSPPGATTGLALTPVREGWDVGRSTGISLATDDADADHAALSEAGVDVDAEVMRMGGPVPPMFFFRDQDGNTLLIVEQTEGQPE
ncbi:MAG: hypothetical protein QOH30_3622 [Baekduia sp.]|nr:hypothetical protein [Baekduia sp.]